MTVTNTPTIKPLFGLAIEVIGRDGSVALMKGNTVVDARPLSIPSPAGTPSPAAGTPSRAASSLIPTIQSLLADSQLSQGCRQPDYVGVAIGPGSFTGLRIAVTAAKTLAFAWDVPLVTINSLAGIAESVAKLPTDDSKSSRILVGLNAYRGQVFRGQFEQRRSSSAATSIVGIDRVELVSASEWKNEVEAIAGQLAAPNPSRSPWPPPRRSTQWRFAGDRAAFERSGIPVDRLNWAGENAAHDWKNQTWAAGIGRLAADTLATGSSSFGQIVSAIDAAPDYFRPSSAEESSTAEKSSNSEKTR